MFRLFLFPVSLGVLVLLAALPASPARGQTPITVNITGDELNGAHEYAYMRGSITICKRTVPAGGTGFNFDSIEPNNPTASFLLNDNDCRTISALGGRYIFWEYGLRPEWQLAAIVCTSYDATTTFTFNPHNATFFTPGDTGVTIDKGPGDNVTCTFTNTATCSTPDGQNISTGINSTAGSHDPDPIWTVTSAPAGVPNLPLAFPVTRFTGMWVPPPVRTNWIDPNDTGETIYTDVDPGGVYVYETSFEMLANVTSFTLTFDYAADDDVQMFVSGPSAFGAPQVVNATGAFAALNGPITFTADKNSSPALVVPETYKLIAHVTNGPYTEDENPTGLLVVGSVTCVLGGGGDRVGGIAEPVALSGASTSASGGSGPSAGAVGAIAGGAAAAAVVLAGAGGWYVRRRWLR